MTIAPSSANTLKALLGDRFLCAACGRHHNPDSRLIPTCQRRLVHQQIDFDRYYSWGPSLSPYDCRLQWYIAQRRLTAPEITIIEQLLTEIRQCAVYDTFDAATLAELTSPDGTALLAARYEQWQRTIAARMAQAQADSDRLIQHLETLLPLPYPTNYPTGHYRDGQRRWTPDPSSQAEIDRVAALFTPPAKIRRFERYMTLAGHLPPGLPTIHRRSRNRVDPNLLGLDPTFWQSATLSKNRLQLRTTFFALTQRDPTQRSPRTPQQQTLVQLSLFE